ncbi:MAG: hypothetical protein WCH41_07985, partial [Methylophilaceae bacterium]
MTKIWRTLPLIGTAFLMTVLLAGCNGQQKEKITELSQLSGKEVGVPTGSVADKLVLSKFSDAKFQY